MMKKQIYLISLFLLAVSERTFLDLGPNTELVTAAMILSAFYFGGRSSILLTLAIMIFSDLVIGNSNIFLFTWSGFLIPAVFASTIIKKLTDHNPRFTNKITSGFKLTGAGLGANLFFFFWTNFGVWLIGSMYPHTYSGLMQSYINALPFLRYQLIGTLFFIPLGFVATESVLSIQKYFDFKKLTNISFKNN